MTDITVLGSGMVGKAMAIDLSRNFTVTVIDINEKSFDGLKKHNNIKTIREDVSSSKTLKKLVADADLVIGAVPGFMGFETVKNVIEAGKNIVDISFFPEDPFELNNLAKNKDVTAVTDCGVAPGMSNMILGFHNQDMQINSFECLVGGLPKTRTLPFEYKAPFSPVDVLEEYTRPSRFVENGKIITKPALSDPEFVDFEGIGTLEAFNTDGLRSLLKTMEIPCMKEKTLRYPGHRRIMEILKDTGFLSDEPIRIKNTDIRPVEFTSKILFPVWELGIDEEEFTVMRISISGRLQGKDKNIVYTMIDKFDKDTKTSSMARTTGYACTAVANLVAKKQYTRKGISPPEYIGMDKKCFEDVMLYLNKRNIRYNVNNAVK
ncbi:saccharopine dehydrogenase NADP-binding domain-containing protein [bacterium]|nr:saccharopine dehydrogenase NADP-binding domain-containing protein [bacterium]